MALTGFRIRPILIDIGSLLVLSAAVIVPQWYLHVTHINLDWSSFFLTAAFPIILSCGLFIPRRRWVLLFAFLALIWAFTDDAPVYLDSVFTWPEVTSGLQHFFLEIVLHVLTLGFIALTIREALRAAARNGRQITRRKVTLSSILGLIAFVLAYAQNIPLHLIEQAVAHSWFQLDIGEHIASVIVLLFAIVLILGGPQNVPKQIDAAARLGSKS